MSRAVAVVVHYGDLDPTVACVRSLAAAEIKAVVVDNGPSPGIAAAVEGIPGVEVIDPGGNLGYAGGNNAGLRRAFELGDYALVVNNDVTVEHPEFVDVLVAALEHEQGAGIAGPLVHAPDGSVQHTVERLPSLAAAVALTLRRPAGPLPTSTSVVAAVNGVCLMISRAAFDATGGFDERYFMYGEEADLAQRARDAGYRTLFVPVPSIVHHHEHGEERGESATRIRVNFVRFCTDHRGPFVAVLVAAWLLAGALVRRRGSRPLVRGIAPVLIDNALAPLLVSLWIVMLALGSAYSPGVRQVGAAGKFGVLLLLVALEVGVALSGPRRYLRRLEPGALHAVSALVVAFSVASALWSPSPRHTLSYAGALALLFAGVLLGPWRLVREGRGERVGDAVLAGLAIVVAGNVLAALVHPHLAVVHPPGGGSRFRGLLESPNEIAAYVLVAPLAAWRAMLPRSRRNRVFAALVFLFLAAQVIASGTRTGVALLVAVVVLLGTGYVGGARLALPTLAATVIGGAIVTMFVLTPSIQNQSWWPSSLRPSTFATLSGRTQAWAGAEKLTARRPLTGFGLGEESTALNLYRAEGQLAFDECAASRTNARSGYNTCEALVPRARRLIDFSGAYVHNSYLGLAVQLGLLVALLESVVVLAAIWWIGAAVRRRDPLGAALFAAAVTGAAWAIVSTYLWNPGNIVAGIFWLLLALGVARAQTTEARA
jgi:N-acetylglucosaminyl-diphospho-decaprenol L-rhamnosyltransferase